MKPNRCASLSIHGWKIRISRIIVRFVLASFMIIASQMVKSAFAFEPQLRLPWPSGIAYVISGSQYNVGYHTGNDYYAIDFGLPLGATVTAAQGGYVTTFPMDCTIPCYGNRIIIDHGNGFTTLYAHLSAFAPNINGMYVSQGQYIGQAGDTGVQLNPDGSHAYHLHFVARFNGGAYMPEPMSGYTGFGNLANYRSTAYYVGRPAANVLHNGSFENDHVFPDTSGPWERDSTTVYAIKNDSPIDGKRYLEINTGPSYTTGLFWQYVPLNGNDFSQFRQPRTFISTPDTWTLRALMRSPNCLGAHGSIGIWAMDDAITAEPGYSTYNLGTQWQPVTASTYFIGNGHDHFRVQLYMADGGCNFDFDNVTFQRNYLNNLSFEDGVLTPWYSGQALGGCQINYAIYGPPGAKDNQKYLEANRNGCTTSFASVLQDVTAYPSVNAMYQARVWVRSPTGDRITGSVALWEKDGPSGNANDSTSFDTQGLGSDWQEVTVTHVIQNAGRDKLTLELYMNDTFCYGGNCQYDFDGAQLYYNGTVYDDADTSQLAYSAGQWTHSTIWDKASGGTVSFTFQPGDSVSKSFFGNSITYVFTKAANRAVANVVVDGTLYQVNQYAVAPGGEVGWWQQSQTFPVNPALQTHTITITHSGQNQGCTGTCYIDVDALIAK